MAVKTRRWKIGDSVRNLTPEALKALKPEISRAPVDALEGAIEGIQVLINETSTSLLNKAEFKAGLAVRLMWICITSEISHQQWDYIQAALEVETLKDRIRLLEDELASREASNG